MAKGLKKAAPLQALQPAADQVRTAVRFPMQLPLRITTPDHVLEATTIDISANGILISGNELPAVDTRIAFTIAMPAAVMGAENDVSIDCIGRVIRHQRDGRKHEAAVIIDEYTLRN